MTVDVEEHYQVQAFAGRIARADWPTQPSRVVANTERLIGLLDDASRKATFFVLGCVAERHPALVRRIVAEGHELASHGYWHVRVDRQTPEEFRADIRKTKRLLEDIGGVPVLGYRAASFSIGRAQFWAYPLLAEEGYRYSSSIYPVRHDIYGMPDAPRFAFRPTGDRGAIELPMSTNRLFGRNLPCSGGGWFRLLPYAASRWQLARAQRREARPAIFYLHPWEIDPDQPRQDGIALRTRVRHYTGLRRTAPRLRRLLRDFHWDRLDRAFAGELA